MINRAEAEAGKKKMPENIGGERNRGDEECLQNVFTD